MPDFSILGRKLEDLISRSGIAKARVARQLGVSGSSINQMISDPKRRPTLHQGWELSELFKVPILYLIDDSIAVGPEGIEDARLRTLQSLLTTDEMVLMLAVQRLSRSEALRRLRNVGETYTSVKNRRKPQ